jgi:hypothetical protein
MFSRNIPGTNSLSNTGDLSHSKDPNQDNNNLSINNLNRAEVDIRRIRVPKVIKILSSVGITNKVSQVPLIHASRP